LTAHETLSIAAFLVNTIVSSSGVLVAIADVAAAGPVTAHHTT
jgi:hypothetical protein